MKNSNKVRTVEIGTETEMAFIEDYIIESEPLAALVDDPFPENPFEEIAEVVTGCPVTCKFTNNKKIIN